MSALVVTDIKSELFRRLLDVRLADKDFAFKRDFNDRSVSFLLLSG